MKQVCWFGLHASSSRWGQISVIFKKANEYSPFIKRGDVLFQLKNY